MDCSLRKFTRGLLSAAAVSAQILIFPAHAATIGPEVHNGTTVWTGVTGTELDLSQIGSLVGQPDLALFYASRLGAQIATNDGADDAARARRVIFTATEPGLRGLDITVTIVNPMVADSPLTVSVNGREIIIRLATNSSGAVTSTAAQVTAAVNAHPAAAGFVVASTGGNPGAGVVDAMSTTALAPVVAEDGSFAGAYDTSIGVLGSARVDQAGGSWIVASSLFLYVQDAALSSSEYYIYDLLAAPYMWNGIDSLFLEGFGLLAGGLSNLKLVGVSAVTVPEGSSIALIVVGLVAVAWSHRRRVRPSARSHQASANAYSSMSHTGR